VRAVGRTEIALERSARVLARVITTAGLLLGVSLVFSGCDSSDPTVPDRVDAFRVLVFSRTAGFRHTSIESSQSMFRDLDVPPGRVPLPMLDLEPSVVQEVGAF